MVLALIAALSRVLSPNDGVRFNDYNLSRVIRSAMSRGTVRSQMRSGGSTTNSIIENRPAASASVPVGLVARPSVRPRSILVAAVSRGRPGTIAVARGPASLQRHCCR